MVTSRKRERVWALIVREREERALETASEAACRASAIAAIRCLTEPQSEVRDSPDYDAWFARVKSTRRK